MPNRYWVGGTGTWDGANTANWSATSGGTGGASIPTSADDVYLDSNSGTGTVTVTGGVCRSFYCTNSVTGSYSGTLIIGTAFVQSAFTGQRDFILSSSMTFSMPQLVYINFCQSVGISYVDFAGKSIGGYYTLNFGSQAACTVVLLSDIKQNSSSVDFVFNCTLITNNYNVDVRSDNGNAVFTYLLGTNSRLGSSVFTIQTGTIRLYSSTSSAVWESSTTVVNTPNRSSTTISIASGTTATTNRLRIITPTIITGNITIGACTIVGPTTVTSAQPYLAFNGDANGYPTINGNFFTESTAPNRRVLISSGTYGLGQTVAINASTNLSDVDFRDIYVIGTNAPISGTRIGNRGNNTGISFTTAKNVYTVFNGSASANWYDNIWSASSGGSPSLNNFPLAQDTIIVQNNSLTTIFLNATASGNQLGSIDMSARTSGFTVSCTNVYTCYGNWRNGSGTGFGGSSGIIFSGGTTQTITSAGKTFPAGITVDTYGGTVQLADAFINNGYITVTNGSFNSAGYAINSFGILSQNSNVRSISLGASTLTLVTGSAINFSTSTNLTFDAGTSSILANSNSATVDGGDGVTFHTVTLASAALSASVRGANTFTNLTINVTTAGRIGTCSFFANQIISGTLTCAGSSAITRNFLVSSTIGTQRTLTAAAISATDCDFRDINLAGAASGASPTRAGDCGGNTGITFPAPKTVYWNLAGAQNWSATAWAPSSGGTPDINNFPLAQDTAVFDDAGSVTGIITIERAWNIGTFDASLRTSAMTLFQVITSGDFPSIYGDWKFGTGVTMSSTSGTINFAKNGTQTITSNGVQFGCSISVAVHPSGTVQLADALSLNSLRTLTLGVGAVSQARNRFDAVTYNVTTGAVNCQSSGFDLRMGSGTWTLSGTGSVWNMAAIPIITVGTSTIVLSDTSTTARTFAGAGLYYNKLTIGGTTGTSTLTITGQNTFGELASTKTVAHTILFQSSVTTTIGKWSVTGSAGNAVTIGPQSAATAYTLSINGPATSGIDYLSISYCTVSTSSPGEFYVGANSTNTAGNTRVVFTAPPSPRTLYWRGGTGNWSSTTSWDTVQNGAGGAAIPTSLDSVIFDSTSNATAYTVTIDAGVTQARCASFTMAGPASGNVTLAGTIGISFHGNVSFAATGITRTYTGAIQCAGNSSYTFTTNGLSLANNITITGIDSTWTLGSPLLMGGVTALSITYGTFSTSASNHNISGLYFFTIGGTNKRTLNLNGSTITMSGSSLSFIPTTNLTFNAGTSDIFLTNASSTLDGGGLTFYNIRFNPAAGFLISINGANTFNTFKYNTYSNGTGNVEFSANQTIASLDVSGSTPIQRTFLRSNTIGVQRTLTVGSIVSTQDIDFRDINIAGAVAPISGTRLGDCGGNSGITFPAAKTVYWNLAGTQTWSATGWATGSGGTPAINNFPLAQDTAVFDNAGAAGTVTIDNSWNIGTIDSTLRSSGMTLGGSTSFTMYGDLKFRASGFSNGFAGNITLAGRNKTIYLNPQQGLINTIAISAVGSTVELQSNLSIGNNNFQLSAGTFNQNNFTISAPTIVCDNTYTKIWNMGSGTVTSTGAGGISFQSSATVTGTGTFNLTSASTKSFQGNGISFSGITLNQGGAGTLSVSGNNTFANISKSFTGATTISLGSAITRVGAWTSTGTAGNLLSITGTSAASPATLIYTGAGTISGINYVDVSFIRAYPLATTWNVGANSTSRSSSLGFILPAITRQKAGNFLAFF